MEVAKICGHFGTYLKIATTQTHIQNILDGGVPLICTGNVHFYMFAYIISAFIWFVSWALFGCRIQFVLLDLCWFGRRFAFKHLKWLCESIMVDMTALLVC